MNEQQLIAAVIGGGVGSFLTQLVTSLRAFWNRKQEGRFTALLLALFLEDYAGECTEPIDTLANFAASSQSTSEPRGSVPALAEYPAKTDWRSLDMELASAVLGFRVKVSSARNEVSGAFEHEGPTSAWGAAADQAVELGAGALALSRRLRSAFRLPPMPAEAHRLSEYFGEKLVDLNDRREEMRRRLAAMKPGDI